MNVEEAKGIVERLAPVAETCSLAGSSKMEAESPLTLTLSPAKPGERGLRRGPRGTAAMIAFAIASFLSGCGGEAGGDERLVTYVCTETRAVVQAEAQPTPALNPATGRRTLVRGMYCAECREWYPVPADARHPQAIRCRRHGTPMSLSGPNSDLSSTEKK